MTSRLIKDQIDQIKGELDAVVICDDRDRTLKHIERAMNQLRDLYTTAYREHRHSGEVV